MNMLKLNLACAGVMLFFGTALLSHAQSLGMAPGIVRYEFKPGVPFQVELNVSNYSDAPLDLHVQITDFWYDDKNEKVFATPGASPRSAANWIQFVPETFHLVGKGTQKMKAIVTPPANAEGGYYATLFVESQPVLTSEVTAEGRAVYTNMRLGCLVVLAAAGSDRYNVKIDDLRIQPPSATHDLEAAISVDNQSNTHIFPVPRLTILDEQGKVVAKAQGEEKRYLPGQKDTMAIKWSGNLAPGLYTGVLTVVYGEKNVETKQLRFQVE